MRPAPTSSPEIEAALMEQNVRQFVDTRIGVAVLTECKAEVMQANEGLLSGMVETLEELIIDIMT